jgi:hypothetical protein
LQERKQSKEYSAITTPCDTESQVKKIKEQNTNHNNCVTTANQGSITNSINHPNYSNSQTKSGLISQIHNLNTTHTQNQISLYNNLIHNINNSNSNSNNNSSNKIYKTGNSQIKISSHTNSNINIGGALNNLHNNNYNISSIGYNTNANLSGNNSKENLIKSNNNNLANNNNNNDHILTQNYNPNNVNINLAAAKSNLINNINNNNNSNLKEISCTTKKNLQNSKIIKNNYIFNSNNNAKVDLNIKPKVENKYENKSGKVDRIEKPDYSKFTKDKKEASNYNKIVIFSNNYNPKILKERVFLTKQPTNKNSRKTSSEKNAEKIIAFYTNSLQTNPKPIGKNTVLSSGNIDPKNNILNLNNVSKDNVHYNQINFADNSASQKKNNFNASSVFDSQNYLISSNNFQKMHSSLQSSLEKSKPSEFFKSKNIGNPKVDYSLVNTEENAYDQSKL